MRLASTHMETGTGNCLATDQETTIITLFALLRSIFAGFQLNTSAPFPDLDPELSPDQAHVITGGMAVIPPAANGDEGDEDDENNEGDEGDETGFGAGQGADDGSCGGYACGADGGGNDGGNDDACGADACAVDAAGAASDGTADSDPFGADLAGGLDADAVDPGV